MTQSAPQQPPVYQVEMIVRADSNLNVTVEGVNKNIFLSIGILEAAKQIVASALLPKDVQMRARPQVEVVPAIALEGLPPNGHGR